MLRFIPGAYSCIKNHARFRLPSAHLVDNLSLFLAEFMSFFVAAADAVEWGSEAADNRPFIVYSRGLPESVRLIN